MLHLPQVLILEYMLTGWQVLGLFVLRSSAGLAATAQGSA